MAQDNATAQFDALVHQIQLEHPSMSHVAAVQTVTAQYGPRPNPTVPAITAAVKKVAQAAEAQHTIDSVVNGEVRQLQQSGASPTQARQIVYAKYGLDPHGRVATQGNISTQASVGAGVGGPHVDPVANYGADVTRGIGHGTGAMGSATLNAASGYTPPASVGAQRLRAHAQAAVRSGDVAGAAKALVASIGAQSSGYDPQAGNPVGRAGFGYDRAAGGMGSDAPQGDTPGGHGYGGGDGGMQRFAGPQVVPAQAPAASPYVTNANPDLSYIDPNEFNSIITDETTPGFHPTGPAYIPQGMTNGQPGQWQTPQYSAAVAANNIANNPYNKGQNTQGNLDFLRALEQERVAALGRQGVPQP